MLVIIQFSASLNLVGTSPLSSNLFLDLDVFFLSDSPEGGAREELKRGGRRMTAFLLLWALLSAWPLWVLYLHGVSHL